MHYGLNLNYARHIVKIMITYSQIVTWGLITVHWVTMYVEIILQFMRKSVKALSDAHIPSKWLFTERNSIPWSKKNTSETNLSSYPSVYYPDLKKFYIHSRGGVKGGFNDVVTAELVNSDRTISYDMSSFFHEISWEGDAPSLYEVVLVYFLSKDTVFPKDSMKGFKLEILTAEAKEVTIKISSVEGMTPFTNWDKF